MDHILSRLNAIRSEQALSMRELSNRSGVSTSTIVRAEKGEPMYSTTVLRLAKALGVTPAELRGPAPVTQSYAAPHRAATAQRSTTPALARALAEAERCRLADDLAGAERWEQIAAGIAASTAAGEHRGE